MDNNLHYFYHRIGTDKDDVIIFEDVSNRIIYYREFKTTIELDDEELEEFTTNLDNIKQSLTSTYQCYNIDCGILNWCVYNERILETIPNVKMDFMEDFMDSVGEFWDENDYYEYFREIGTILKSKKFNCSVVN